MTARKHDSEALRREIERLRRWKAEALPLLTKYDDIAESVGGELGSSKVDNLAKVVARLRTDKAKLLAALEMSLQWSPYQGESEETDFTRMARAAIAAAKESTP